MRRGALLAPLLVAACSSFSGTAPSPSPDAGTPDARVTVVDAGTVDAADAGIPSCDSFERTDLLGPGSMWLKTGGNAPLPAIQDGALFVQTAAQTDPSPQSPGLLYSVVRPRGNTLHLTSTITFDELDVPALTGRLRLFNLDASVDIGDGEYAAVEVMNGAWEAGYHDAVSGTFVTSAADFSVPKVVANHAYRIDFTVVFDPTQGSIALSVDGAQVVSQTGLASDQVSRTTWQLILGLEPHGASPLAKAHYDDLCVSP